MICALRALTIVLRSHMFSGSVSDFARRFLARENSHFCRP